MLMIGIQRSDIEFGEGKEIGEVINYLIPEEYWVNYAVLYEDSLYFSNDSSSRSMILLWMMQIIGVNFRDEWIRCKHNCTHSIIT